MKKKNGHQNSFTYSLTRRDLLRFRMEVQLNCNVIYLFLNHFEEGDACVCVGGEG